MPGSPLDASPYAVLGVPGTATDAELRRAFRRRLRETHPDTGGSSPEFDRVQRAWEQVGTAEARAAYDAGVRPDSGKRTWAPAPPAPRPGSARPHARVHGHPGGWFRERYLELLREWVGRGVDIPDPYDPRLVRSAPPEIRHLLASAVAEEETARVLAGLGIGFTVWHDVRAGGDGGKIDHVVVGPSGVWALMSEDWGDRVAVRRGDLIGPGILRDEHPIAELAGRARWLARRANVRFTALGIVVPDGAGPEGVVEVGTVRGTPAVLVERPRLAHLLASRPANTAFGGGDQFEVRTRIQSAVEFV